MIIVRELSTWHPPANGAIVCLGVFDGVHLGHRRVLEETVRWARAESAAAGVVTFDRKPRRLAARSAPPLLLSVEHRMELFRQTGFDFAVLLAFTEALAGTAAEAFVRDILCDRIAVRGVVLGFDQRFGKDRAGDFALLQRLGRTHGFEVRQTPAMRVLGDIVSSTRIRDAIRSGRLAEAAAMLGRPVTCRGNATRNEATSRKTGHPTFVLDLHHEVRPPCGVYAVHVTGGDADVLALCNISASVHPEHGGACDLDEYVVEVCFQDLPGNIEGQEIDLAFLDLIREEMRFADAGQMRRRIRRDFDHLAALRNADLDS